MNMTNKQYWHSVIRERLRREVAECRNCLYSDDGYEWGSGSKKGIQQTLKLMNTLLKDVPIEAWPKTRYDGDDQEYLECKIAHNNWRIKLLYDCDKRGIARRCADLKFRNDDHTAWVIESKRESGKFIDFDIGGS